MTGWAAETLVTTTILMAVVLLVREPFAKLFGARAAYALWLIPLLRMVTPPLPVETPIPQLTMGIVAGPAAGAPAMPMVPASGSAVGELFLALWLGGAILFLAWHLIAYRRFVRRALAEGRLIDRATSSRPELIESPAVPGPMASGILRPRIFLPAGFFNRLSNAQCRLAIAHERLHHRRGDLIALASSLVVLALHWFNPIAYAAHRAFRRDLEAACDAQLVERLGPEEREAYARAIVGSAAAPMPAAVCGLTPIDDLKRRLNMLNTSHGLGARLSGIAIAASLAAGATLATSGAQAQTPPESRTETVEVERAPGPQKVTKRFHKTLGVAEAPVPARCDNVEDRFEAELGGQADKLKFFICNKGGGKAGMVQTLEEALQHVRSDSEMPAQQRDKLIPLIQAEITRRRAAL